MIVCLGRVVVNELDSQYALQMAAIILHIVTYIGDFCVIWMKLK